MSYSKNSSKVHIISYDLERGGSYESLCHVDLARFSSPDQLERVIEAIQDTRDHLENEYLSVSGDTEIVYSYQTDASGLAVRQSIKKKKVSEIIQELTKTLTRALAIQQAQQADHDTESGPFH